MNRAGSRRLTENGYFPQSQRQAQILILEILQCIPLVKISAFLDLGKNISFSDSLLGARGMPLEKPIKVRILDQEYLIKSNENEEHVEKVAQFVNEKFREIKESAAGLSEKKTAILAAFDIASEFFQLLEERNDVVMDIQRRSRALNYHIDSVTTT